MFGLALFASLVVLSIPILLENEPDPFNPFVFFSISFGIGAVSRSFYMWSKGTIEAGSLLETSILALVGNVFLIAGYLSVTKKNANRLITLKWAKNMDKGVVRLFSLLFLLVGIFSLFYVVEARGILKDIYTGAVSSKREIKNGYIVWGVEVLMVSSTLQIIIILKGSGRKYIDKLLFLVPYLSFIFFAFWSSSRGKLLKALLVPAVIYHYHVKNIKVYKMIAAGSMFTLLFSSMSLLRSGRLLDYTRLGIRGIFDSLEQSFLEGSYMFDIVTFEKILSKVPAEVPYQYGKTLLTWTVMPVPRSIWPDKPINLGQFIGANIYNQGIGIVGGGVPPPFPSELFLNFGVLGIPIGMFFFGMLIKCIYSLTDYRYKNITKILIYSSSLIALVAIFNGGLSAPIVGFLKFILPILGALYVSHAVQL